MFGLNESNLVGRIGAEPTVNSTNNGGRVASFSVATDESYITKDGQKIDKTEWHRVVTFMPGLIDRIERLQKTGALKGKLVFIRGKNRTRSYQVDGEAKSRFVTEILLDAGSKFQPLEKTATATATGAPEAAPAATPEALPEETPAATPATPATPAAEVKAAA